MSWQKVKLGSILTESKVISENPDTNKRIKVRLKVLGVEKRGVENEVEGATKQFIRRAGQFIFGKQNFHKGAFGIIPEELDGFESSSDLPAFDIDKSCLPEFLFYFFKQGNYYLELSKIAYGVATQRINMKEFYELEIPLPDIEIQKQIINQLKTLENSGGEISDELTHQLDLIKQLRQAFLREAMQGNLVDGSKLMVDGVETGRELLAKIKAEKAQLIAEKKLKKEKELAPIAVDEIPFEIPEHWGWCRFQDITKVITCGLASTPIYRKEGRMFLSAKNIKPFRFMPENFKYVDEETYRKVTQNAKPEINDILITRVGAGIGETALIDQEIDFAYYVSLTLVKPFNKISSNYLQFWLNSPSGIQSAISFTTGSGSSQGNLNVEKVRSFLIPIPPLHEQEQIVAKLEELMAFCDGLEQSIKESQGYNEHLLQQVLRDALQGNKI